MKKGGIRAYIIWITGSLFYLYEYFVRVVPSVIENDLEITYCATASQVAIAVGMYLLIYSPMQLIVGPLFDTCGSRKLFLPASVILTFSCLLPILPTHTLACFGVSRFLMGFSSAFGFVGVMYLCTVWFHKKHLATLSGLTTALGLLGAIAAQTSLSWINNAWGWQSIWIISFIFGIFITLLLLIFIPNAPDWLPKPKGKHIWIQCKNNLIYVAKRWPTWNIGLISGALFMPLAVFADLWGIPYFTKICNFSMTEASQLTSILNLSWALGAPIVGWISDTLNTRKTPLLISGLSSGILLAILVLCPSLSFVTTAILLIGLGFCASGQVIGFIACAELNPPQTNASSIAFVNMIIMGFCGLIQALVGHMIDCYSLDYSIAVAYQIGLGTIVIALFATSFIFGLFFKRKTKHNKV